MTPTDLSPLRALVTEWREEARILHTVGTIHLEQQVYVFGRCADALARCLDTLGEMGTSPGDVCPYCYLHGCVCTHKWGESCRCGAAGPAPPAPAIEAALTDEKLREAWTAQGPARRAYLEGRGIEDEWAGRCYSSIEMREAERAGYAAMRAVLVAALSPEPLAPPAPAVGTEPIGARLLRVMQEHSESEAEADDAIVAIMGGAETLPETWGFSHITYDAYDSSFELKKATRTPTKEQAEQLLALGFERFWVCHDDGSETYIDGRNSQWPGHRKHPTQRMPLPDAPTETP